MKHEIDLSKYRIHTDLAIEATAEIINEVQVEEKGDIKITSLFLDQEKARKIHKKSGNYITIEFKDVTDHQNRYKLTEVLTDTLTKILKKLNIYQKKCLVIGLGNVNSTPDSLGPKVVREIVVTSHIASITELEKGFTNVSSYAIGVKGESGIETIDIVKGLTKASKPDFVIVIDALASQSLERLNRTIQISDAGINPGSGVGNDRKEISKKSLKIPVIALGVPTVIDLFTIIKTYGDLKQSINEEYNFMVTPKEIDFILNNLVEVIADSINCTLHPALSNN